MYARIDNGVVAEYPLTEQQVRDRFPSTSFPSDFAGNLPTGYARVQPASAPTASETTVVSEATPALVDGVWTQSWSVADKYTAEELAAYNQLQVDKKWDLFRSGRDSRLLESDWVIARHKEQKELGVTTSIQDSEYMAWLTYRQQLRDLPSQVTDPESVVWPTPPGQLGVA